jgi:ketosteroid isomerase-like protein
VESWPGGAYWPRAPGEGGFATESMHARDDEQEIVKLFEDGDRALMAADQAELSRIFAADYIQYDDSGKAFTKQDVLNLLKTGSIRYVSMVSTGRRIRLFGNIAVVHGSEENEVEQDGKRFPVRYVYMDVVRKRKGRWKIVASQLARASGK